MAIAAEAPAGLRSLELARANFALGRVTLAATAVDQGLDAVGGSDSPVEAFLTVERARILNHAAFGMDRRALDAARAAVAISERAGAGRDEALLELAKARYAAGEPGCLNAAENALRAFLHAGNLDATLSASIWIAQMQEGWRRRREARSTARATAQLAAREGKEAYAAIACWQLARFTLLGADADRPTLAELRQVVVGRPLGAFRVQALGELALALADAGDAERAREALRSAENLEQTEYDALNLLFYRGELAFLAGRPDRAIDAILAAGSVPSIIALTCDWALFAVGAAPLGVSLPRGRPGNEGFGLEGEAFRALRDAQPRAAAEAFCAAADRHEGQLLRHSLRCTWGAGEALLRAGYKRDARAQLRRAEELARSSGSAGMLSRIRASLRLFDPATRRTGAALSSRQRQVLDLVALGRTTAEIADELCIGRSSVETHVAAARAKLGAATRLAAAVAKHTEPRARVPLRRDLRHVANLLAGGATVREVAASLEVSPRTAARRIAELREAVGATSTVAAVASLADEGPGPPAA